MRILLTGAGGLIGSAMHRHLAQAHDIVTLGRRGHVDVRADLSVPEELNSLDLPAIDALIHCAGVVDEDFVEDPRRAMQMAMFGADALVQRAVRAGASRLAYISSAHVYGPMRGHIDERNPANPVSNYAIAHFATEQVFRRYAQGGIAAAALRPCAVFGGLADPARFRRWSLIPFSFPRDAVIDHHIVIRSTGEQRRNFVGTEDIAECCNRWLDQATSGWMGLNPLGATTSSVHDLAKTCAALSETITGRPCKITRVAPTGADVGSDFSYESVYGLTQGRQSMQDALERLMHAILEG